MKSKKYLFIVAAFVFFLGQALAVTAGIKSPPPEKAPVIIIGDRVVDIAYNLGIMPEAMSVRGSMWPMAKKLKMVSQILGCPNCVTKKRKNAVPNALRQKGIKKVIIEKNDNYCLYMPEVKPEDVVPLLAGLDVQIEYVDFSKGLASAVQQTADLLGCKDKAQKVIGKYKKQLAAAKANLPTRGSGKKAVILNGTYQQATGKFMLRAEAPGGYADKFLLGPLGYTNAGDAFCPASGQVARGHYLVTKKRGKFDFSPLIKADPDVIIAEGNSLAVQKSLANYLKNNPEFCKVKAIQNMAIYTLPAYIDSSILEYPKILQQWTTALHD